MNALTMKGGKMDSCCDRPSPSTRHQACPSCGTSGRPVEAITLRSLLHAEHLFERLGGFRFCATPTCQVVYFNEEGATFREAELRVAVWQKHDDPTVPICYCFGWNEDRIRTEIAETGKSTALSAISAQVRAGACNCAINNPQGSCCLGNISRVVNRNLFEVQRAE